jgi:hypothetical protein
MDKSSIYNYDLFNRIKLKHHKPKDLERLCDRSKKIVNTTNEEISYYYKYSNGIINNENKSTARCATRKNTTYKNFILKKHSRPINLYASSKLDKLILPRKNSYERKETTEIRETRRETLESPKLILRPAEDRKSVLKKPFILPAINHILNSPDRSASPREESKLYPILENPSAKVASPKRTRNIKTRIEKAFYDKALTEASDILTTSPSALSPQITLPTENTTETIHKLLSDFNKVPSRNVRKRFSKLYDEFNGIAKSNMDLSVNIEKSFDIFMNNMEQIFNREKIEQNKIFERIEREKLFIMEDVNKKETFVKQLDKNQVLKEYNLINILNDELAKDVLSKYVKLEVKEVDHSERRYQKHKKVREILDAMQYSKHKY